MEPLVISLIAFGCICGGLLLGMVLRTVLPQHHLNADSKDVVKLGIGMLATLAALVLGLLIASAKGNFDKMSNGLVQLSSKIILLDRIMANYGPETREARDLLRRSVASALERLWIIDRTGQEEKKGLDPKAGLEILQKQLRQLSPQDDAQRWLQSRAMQVSGDIANEVWLISVGHRHSSLPMPVLVILVSWLVFIFFSFGLLSPRNATVIVVLVICAFSAAASLSMILELDRPYGGLITVSSAPMKEALGQLGR
jgi:hypothetical protein